MRYTNAVIVPESDKKIISSNESNILNASSNILPKASFGHSVYLLKNNVLL